MAVIIFPKAWCVDKPLFETVMQEGGPRVVKALQLDDGSVLPPQVEHCMSTPDVSGRVGHVLPNPQRVMYTELAVGKGSIGEIPINNIL